MRSRRGRLLALHPPAHLAQVGHHVDAQALVGPHRDPTDLACNLLNLLARTRGHRHLHAGPGELSDYPRADAATAAGHERNLPCQFSVRHAAGA